MSRDDHSLVAELYADLVTLDPAQTGCSFEDALARIGQSYELDFCGLWWFEHKGLWSQPHLWATEEMADVVARWPRELTEKEVAWPARRIVQGEVVAVTRSDDLPPEADSFRELLAIDGIVSELLIPVLLEEQLVGAFEAGTCRRSRTWSERDIAELRTLGQVIASCSARVKTVQALRESERRYRNVIEDQTEFIVRWKPDGTRTFVNEAYCRIFGGTPEELVGTSFLPLISPEDRDKVTERLSRIDARNPVSTDEHRVTLPDGSIGWQRWTDRGVFSPDGTLLEMQSVGRDVTDRRLVEEELRRHAKFQALVARISSRLLQANPEAMDEPIHECLGWIGESYEVDFCGLWWFENRGEWIFTHLWTVDEVAGAAESWRRRYSVSEVEWTSERMLANEIVRTETPDDYPPEAQEVRVLNKESDTVAHVLIPMRIEETFVGSFEAGTCTQPRRWTDGTVEELRTLGEVIAAAYARARARAALQKSESELRSLKQQLEVENVFLREEVRQAHGSGRIVGESPVLLDCLHLVNRVAPTDAPVLITGETGTGKELIARAIHERSGRAGPIVSINCAALPANLVESELFGYEKGAFTGAEARKPGRLELAERGTLFLDEIGEVPPELQAKLLRALQEGEFERVGGVETLKFHGRVVAATNRDLEASVSRGEFRSDLYYRLNVFPIVVPSLGDRKEDIPLLAHHFVAKHAASVGREISGISQRLIDHIISRDWPGNIRELESFIQRVLIVGRGPVLDLEPSLAPAPAGPTAPGDRDPGRRLQDVERDHILRILTESEWVVEGERGAATRLGLAPSTLRSRMKKLGIRRDG